MLQVVKTREVMTVLDIIEDKLEDIKSLTEGGHNAGQECEELLEYVKNERLSLVLPTKDWVAQMRSSR